MNIISFGPVLEKRTRSRNPKQMFVRIKVLDGQENEAAIALTTDINEDGITLITQIPLPVGTNVIIKNDNFTAVGEVCDWNWEYAIDMARLGIRLVKKQGVWPKG